MEHDGTIPRNPARNFFLLSRFDAAQSSSVDFSPQVTGAMMCFFFQGFDVWWYQHIPTTCGCNVAFEVLLCAKLTTGYLLVQSKPGWRRELWGAHHWVYPWGVAMNCPSFSIDDSHFLCIYQDYQALSIFDQLSMSLYHFPLILYTFFHHFPIILSRAAPHENRFPAVCRPLACPWMPAVRKTTRSLDRQLCEDGRLSKEKVFAHEMGLEMGYPQNFFGIFLGETCGN